MIRFCTRSSQLKTAQSVNEAGQPTKSKAGEGTQAATYLFAVDEPEPVLPRRGLLLFLPLPPALHESPRRRPLLLQLQLLLCSNSITLSDPASIPYINAGLNLFGLRRRGLEQPLVECPDPYRLPTAASRGAAEERGGDPDGASPRRSRGGGRGEGKGCGEGGEEAGGGAHGAAGGERVKWRASEW